MEYGKQLTDNDGSKVQYLFEAVNAGNKETVIVYQKLSGDFPMLVEEKTAFCRRFGITGEETAVKKTVEYNPSFRSKMNRDEVQIPEPIGREPKELEKSQTPQEANKDLLRFLDAETSKERIEILLAIQERADKRLLSNIAAALDITLGDGGTLEEDIDAVLSYLRTRARFEIHR